MSALYVLCIRTISGWHISNSPPLSQGRVWNVRLQWTKIGRRLCCKDEGDSGLVLGRQAFQRCTVASTGRKRLFTCVDGINRRDLSRKTSRQLWQNNGPICSVKAFLKALVLVWYQAHRPQIRIPIILSQFGASNRPALPGFMPLQIEP